MSPRTQAFFATVAVALLFAWLFRYEMVPLTVGGDAGHGRAYRLDRWTGEVRFYVTEEWYPVSRAK